MKVQETGIVEKVSPTGGASGLSGLWEVRVRVSSRKVVRYIGLTKKPKLEVGERVERGQELE